MLCGINTGSRKRRVGDPGHPLRDSAVRNQNQRSLGGTHQSSFSNLSGLRREHIPDSPHSIISRPHTANRRFRLFSMCHFSLFSIPFLADFSRNKKPATEVSRVRVIEGVTDELQLVETKKNSNNSVSATKTYSLSPSDYRLLEVVGQGASATVYRAMYVPYNEIVAIKCLDLDRCSITMDDIRREAQTMSLTYHPNVVKGYCSFVVERKLWFVMPFMAEGSCLQLMKVAFPDGFEEQVIGSILKETLKALDYFHKSGHIHRDVKAGNILLDSSGSVKLSDFGVFASLFDKGDRQHSRNTFVGTPCWMAPEVMRPEGGYDFKADIWSFGITALELAHGHAPFSKYPPMKVLLLTLQNAPPGLDYDRDKKFSKSFKEMIAMCLVKDQTKRPTAEKLLKHAFFKNVKPPEFCVKSLFADLPSLWDRMKMLQLKDAEHLALKKMPSSVQEALSQSEYQRGISAWNFDIEDLKVQASLLQDDEGFVETKDDDGSLRNLINNKIPDNKDISEAEEDSDILRILVGKKPHSSESHLVKPLDENSDIPIIDAEGPDGGGLVKETEYKETYLQEVKSQDVIGRSDEVKLNNETDPSPSVLDNVQRWNNKVGKIFQTFTSPLPLCDMSNSTPQRAWTFKRDECEIELPIEGLKSDSRQSSNLCGPLILPSYASSNTLSRGYEDYQEDMHRANVVQTKGRFSVNFVNADIVKDAVTEREYFLLIKVLELQARIGSLTDELTAARLKHAQLQQELRNACSREMKKTSNF